MDSQFPKNEWKRTSVGALFEIDSGASPQNFHPGDFSGPILVYGANGPIGSSNKPNYGPGLLIGRVGAAGAITSISNKVWASDNTLTVTPKIDVCDRRFAVHFLRYIDPSKIATITAQPLITQSTLARLTGNVPQQLSEQSRIAYVLDTIDEAIARTEAVVAKFKQVRAGMLHDLLSYGLDEHGQLRDPIAHPEQFKDSPLGLIPKEWEIGPFSEIVSVNPPTPTTGLTPAQATSYCNTQRV